MDFMQGVNGLIEAGRNVGKSVAREMERASGEFREAVVNDVQSISTAVDNRGLLGGAIQAADVFSPGHAVANVLDAYNVIPEDAALRESISAGVNFTMPNLIGLFLGANDLGQALAASGTSMAEAQSAPTPTDGMNETGSPTREAAIEAAKAKSADKRERAEAKEAAIEAAKAKSADKHERAEAKEAAIEAAKAKSAAKRDGYAAGYEMGVQAGLESSYEEAMKRNEELFGSGSTEQAEKLIDKILSNPNLNFEDMIFQLLRAVIKEGQNDVKDMAQDLKNGRTEDAEIKKDYGKLIDDKTAEIAKEPDQGKKNDLQNELVNLREERAEKLSTRSESRAEVAEDLKNLLAKVSEMQQALSNILNTQHEAAMSAIRNIK